MSGNGTGSSAPVAAIDIGTHAALLLVARGSPHEPHRLLERSTITRLGEGVDVHGRLADDAIARTLTCLEEFRRLADSYGATVIARATSAARSASNVETLLDAAEARLGARPVVVSGEREARLTFEGALVGLEPGGPVTVIDVGGGSTEVISGVVGGIVHASSVEIGAVRLTERHVSGHPISATELSALLDAVASLPAKPLVGRPVVACGGTATTLTAMAFGIASYDDAVVHGAALPVSELDRMIEELASESLATRAARAALPEERADVIVAGAMLVRELARRARADRLITSARGLRWGVAREALAERR